MAHARQSLVLLFAERLMWKALTLQPAKLSSSRVYGLWLGRSQTSNAHLLGTRLGIVVARTIRRLPTAESEESSSVVAMTAHTVTRHALEQKEVVVVLAISGAPLQVDSGGASDSSSKFAQADGCEDTIIIGCSGKQPTSSGDRGDFLVLKTWCLWKWHKKQNRQRCHMLRWTRTMQVSLQRDRGRPRDCWTRLVVQAATDKATDLLRCQQKRNELGFSASSSSRDVLGDVVMGEVRIPQKEVQPPPPPAERPPNLQTSDPAPPLRPSVGDRRRRGVRCSGAWSPMDASDASSLCFS